jgi:DNA gyrase/topoisomerase IV subunit A
MDLHSFLTHHLIHWMQADAVLGLPLRRLTALERNELDKERSDLNTK